MRRIAAAALPLALAAGSVWAAELQMQAAVACLEREAPRMERLSEDLDIAARNLVRVACASEAQAVSEAAAGQIGGSGRERAYYQNRMRISTARILLNSAMRRLIAAREARLAAKP